MSYDEFWFYEPELLNVYITAFLKKREVERKEEAAKLDLLSFAYGIYCMNAIGTAVSGKNKIKEPLRFFREPETKEEMKERITKEIKESFSQSEIMKVAREENIAIKGEAR